MIRIALALLLCTASLAQARPVEQRIEFLLAAPQRVLAFADALGLDNEVQRQLQAGINPTRATVLQLQSEALLALEEVEAALDAEAIDAERALQLLDCVTALEARIKHLQMALWLRSNSLLTRAQRIRARRQ
jgi:hypothetical protein